MPTYCVERTVVSMGAFGKEEDYWERLERLEAEAAGEQRPTTLRASLLGNKRRPQTAYGNKPPPPPPPNKRPKIRSLQQPMLKAKPRPSKAVPLSSSPRRSTVAPRAKGGNGTAALGEAARPVLDGRKHERVRKNGGGNRDPAPVTPAVAAAGCRARGYVGTAKSGGGKAGSGSKRLGASSVLGTSSSVQAVRRSPAQTQETSPAQVATAECSRETAEGGGPVAALLAKFLSPSGGGGGGGRSASAHKDAGGTSRAKSSAQPPRISFGTNAVSTGELTPTTKGTKALMSKTKSRGSSSLALLPRMATQPAPQQPRSNAVKRSGPVGDLLAQMLGKGTANSTGETKKLAGDKNAGGTTRGGDLFAPRSRHKDDHRQARADVFGVQHRPMVAARGKSGGGDHLSQIKRGSSSFSSSSSSASSRSTRITGGVVTAAASSATARSATGSGRRVTFDVRPRYFSTTSTGARGDGLDTASSSQGQGDSSSSERFSDSRGAYRPLLMASPTQGSVAATPGSKKEEKRQTRALSFGRSPAKVSMVRGKVCGARRGEGGRRRGGGVGSNPASVFFTFFSLFAPSFLS